MPGEVGEEASSEHCAQLSREETVSDVAPANGCPWRPGETVYTSSKYAGVPTISSGIHMGGDETYGIMLFQSQRIEPAGSRTWCFLRVVRLCLP